MTAMPDDHCILATAQMWQPQCLGAKEGLHCLLEDAVALILVICSRAQKIRCRLGLWRIEARAMHVLRGPWALADKPFPAPGLCPHRCRRHGLVASLEPQALNFSRILHLACSMGSAPSWHPISDDQFEYLNPNLIGLAF